MECATSLLGLNTMSAEPGWKSIWAEKHLFRVAILYPSNFPIWHHNPEKKTIPNDTIIGPGANAPQPNAGHVRLAGPDVCTILQRSEIINDNNGTAVWKMVQCGAWMEEQPLSLYGLHWTGWWRFLGRKVWCDFHWLLLSHLALLSLTLSLAFWKSGLRI